MLFSAAGAAAGAVSGSKLCSPRSATIMDVTALNTKNAIFFDKNKKKTYLNLLRCPNGIDNQACKRQTNQD